MNVDSGVIVSLVGLVGLLVTQILLHRRWERDQEAKREQARERNVAERQAERSEALTQIGLQNRAVFEDAVKMIDVHRADAEAARAQATVVSAAHDECRKDVARLSGQVDELRDRVIESERTHGVMEVEAEKHRALKHQALNALTISEGGMLMVQNMTGNCTCGALEPIRELIDNFKPRIDRLLDENALPVSEWQAKQHDSP